MAKQRERIARGLSVQDILSMPMSKFEQYTPSQQREIVSRLGSAANRRLKGFQNKNIETPATIRLEMSGGKISVRNKSGEELKNELFRASQFLRSKLSTQTGWKKETSKLITNDAQSQLAFAYYDVLTDKYPELVSSTRKYKIVKQISEIIDDNRPFEDKLRDVSEYIKDEYNEYQREYETIESDFADTLTNDTTPKRFRRKRKRR